jgi:GTPase SAR1 family protein
MGNTGQSISLGITHTHSQPIIGVGKTSLLHRYTQNKFDPKNTTSTTGAFFVTKKVYVDGLKVRLQLWDTAGQERFRSMVRSHIPADADATQFFSFKAPMYYRGANAALLLYDITNASTFDDIRGWLEGMRSGLPFISPRATNVVSQS